MQAMLTSDGAGVLALANPSHAEGTGDDHSDDRHACNLFFLARCIDPMFAQMYQHHSTDEHSPSKRAKSSASRSSSSLPQQPTQSWATSARELH